jgi:polyhydroxyalkanoate synthesis regulator protein
MDESFLKGANKMLTITKFNKNRKLYIPKQGYINHDKLNQYLLNDKQFKVVDNITKADCTKEVLAMLIVTNIKNNALNLAEIASNKLFNKG